MTKISHSDHKSLRGQPDLLTVHQKGHGEVGRQHSSGHHPDRGDVGGGSRKQTSLCIRKQREQAGGDHVLIVNRQDPISPADSYMILHLAISQDADVSNKYQKYLTGKTHDTLR